MTDLRLRELERRWRESGAVFDEAAWVGERLRAGQLEPAAVELAAHLGHGTAGLVLATRPAPARQLLGLIASGGTAACARAAHALAASALERQRVVLPSAVRALSTLERWVEKGAVGRESPHAFPLEHPLASHGKRVRKRVAWVLAAVRQACLIPVHGPRVARVALEATWRTVERLLPSREPSRLVATTVGDWLLHGARPQEEPTRLLVVHRRLELGGGTAIEPGVDLGPLGELRFEVEIRPRWHETGPRCLARAVRDHHVGAGHTLILPLGKAMVPAGVGIWEVGP